MATKTIKDLEQALKSALAQTQNGDPEEAESTLELALRLPMSDDMKRLVNQAKEEVSIGSPEKCEHLIELALFRIKEGGDKITLEEHNSHSLGDERNADRAAWANAALLAFRDQTGADQEDAVADLLGNLMHWCKQNDMDFENELERGRRFFEDEKDGNES